MDFLENGGVQTQNVISLRSEIGLGQIQVLGISGGRAIGGQRSGDPVITLPLGPPVWWWGWGGVWPNPIPQASKSVNPIPRTSEGSVLSPG